jgi:predicted nucleotidyltransferase
MDKIMRDIQLAKLSERAKELKCMYNIHEVLKDDNEDLETIFRGVIEAIPPGWQYPTVCEVNILFDGKSYSSEDYRETPWFQRAELVIDNHISGEIRVIYTQNINESENPFLPEEQKLLNAIAHRLSEFIFHQRLKKTIDLLQSSGQGGTSVDEHSILSDESDEHWKWRYQISQYIADKMDFDRFGVKGIYLIGSTKNATAGPGSDIDLMVHFSGDPNQRKELQAWMEGWGLGLEELNYVKTGYRTGDSLIDFHMITDEDIRNKDSYAMMIGAVTNSARPLKVKKAPDA